MLLSSVNSSGFYSRRFASADKLLEKDRKKVSREYNGMYGIHSIGASVPNKSIKVFVNDLVDVPSGVKAKIKRMTKFRVVFEESAVDKPEDYHLEDAFEED